MHLESLSTARTRGRRIRAGDESLLAELFGNPRVGQTLGGTRTLEETRKQSERFLDHWQRYDFGIWLFHLLESDAFVGYTGIHHVRLDLPDGALEGVELLYASLPEHWGKGLITETSRVIVDLAFEALQIPELLCFTLTTNLSSRRVMEKCGFLYERDFERVGMPHALYRLRRH